MKIHFFLLTLEREEVEMEEGWREEERETSMLPDWGSNRQPRNAVFRATAWYMLWWNCLRQQLSRVRRINLSPTCIKRWIYFCLRKQEYRSLFKKIFVQLQLPHFPPITLPWPTHPSPSTCGPPPPCCLCPWVLYTGSLTWPFPFFPPLSTSPSPLRFNDL